MNRDRLKVTRGRGNVFRDLGHKNADIEQFKAILAAEIIKMLDREDLTVRDAHGRTGIAAADFSRIRNADLGRFTADRLMTIINRLGSRVDVKVKVRRAEVGAVIGAEPHCGDRRPLGIDVIGPSRAVRLVMGVADRTFELEQVKERPIPENRRTDAIDRGRGLNRSWPKERRMSCRRTNPISGLKLSPTCE